MAEKVFKVAVIGCGLIGPAHIDSYSRNPHADLVAICDKDPIWAAYIKDKFGVKYTCTDYHDILNDPEIEVVSVCVPNNMHAQITIDALLAGKHVLCEKPMAISAKQGRKMIEARDKSGRQLMIGQNQRFIPAAYRMKKMFEAGEYGDVYHIRTGWKRPLGQMPSPEDTRENGQIVDRNWYNDKSLHGGVLRDLGVHLLDLAMYVTGFPKFKEATACAYRKFQPLLSDDQRKKYNFTSEDLVSTLIKFENGMSIDLEVSFASTISHEELFTNIYGTKAGTERFEDDMTLISTDDGFHYTQEKLDLSSEPAYHHTSTQFINALLKGEEAPVKPEEALKVLEILDEIYKSSGFTQ